MNKFFNSFKLTVFVLAIVSLAGCKKNVDVFGVSEDLANKSLLGYYTYTALDSTTMQTLKKEFYLNRDNAGNQTGYYRENAAGDGISTDQTTSLTWTSMMAEDKLSMTITATLKDGSVKTFKWADGIIYAAGNSYEKSVANMSNIDVQEDVYKQVDNAVFECADTTFHDNKVKNYYLEWKMNGLKTAKTKAAADQIVEQEEAKLNLQIDTIIWFLRYKAKDRKIGTDTYLKVKEIQGNDTIFEVVGLTKVGAVVNPDNVNDTTYNILYLKSKQTSEEIQINDRPKTIVYSKIVLNNVNNVKTGSYIWKKSYAGKEHYTKPGTSKNDTVLDSVYTFTVKKWAVPSFTNQAKFDILFYGDGDSTVTRTEKGVADVLMHKEEKDAHLKLEMFGYKEKKNKEGVIQYIEVQQGDIIYRKK